MAISLGPGLRIEPERFSTIVYNATIWPKEASSRGNFPACQVFAAPPQPRTADSAPPAGSALRAHPAHELLEAGELQLDHVAGRLVGELQRLLVELLGREGDDHLRLG